MGEKNFADDFHTCFITGGGVPTGASDDLKTTEALCWHLGCLLAHTGFPGVCPGLTPSTQDHEAYNKSFSAFFGKTKNTLEYAFTSGLPMMLKMTTEHHCTSPNHSQPVVPAHTYMTAYKAIHPKDGQMEDVVNEVKAQIRLPCWPTNRVRVQLTLRMAELAHNSTDESWQQLLGARLAAVIQVDRERVSVLSVAPIVSQAPSELVQGHHHLLMELEVRPRQDAAHLPTNDALSQLQSLTALQPAQLTATLFEGCQPFDQCACTQSAQLTMQPTEGSIPSETSGTSRAYRVVPCYVVNRSQFLHTQVLNESLVQSSISGEWLIGQWRIAMGLLLCVYFQDATDLFIASCNLLIATPPSAHRNGQVIDGNGPPMCAYPLCPVPAHCY